MVLSQKMILGDLVVEGRVLMEIFSALTSEDRRYNLARIPLETPLTGLFPVSEKDYPKISHPPG